MKFEWGGFKESFQFDNGNFILLFKPFEGEGLGFEAALLKFNSCPADQNDLWGEETECEVWFEVDALHDGVRHIWWKGEDGDGYLNYMNPRVISEIMLKLRELEILFCSEHGDS